MNKYSSHFTPSHGIEAATNGHITMFYIGIALLVEKKEITETVIHLQFRFHQAVVSKRKIGFKKPLQISFFSHAVTYGRISSVIKV